MMQLDVQLADDPVLQEGLRDGQVLSLVLHHNLRAAQAFCAPCIRKDDRFEYTNHTVVERLYVSI
jgi:hypothetical protein